MSTKTDRRRPRSRAAERSFELDLHALLRFLEVHERGSFAAAARSLGISRQAVHRSVDAIEQGLRTPLFDRTAHTLRPTSVGRELLRHAIDLRAIERRVRGAASSAQATPSGIVRVTAPPVFGQTVLRDAVVSFLSTWRDVRVVAHTESERTDLVRDDYDLMVRIGAAPPDEHFAVHVGRARVVVCASPRYLAAHGAPRLPADLTSHALVEYAARPSTRWSFVGERARAEVAVAPRLASDEPSIVVDACLAGVGVLRAPRLAVAEHLEEGRLVTVLDAYAGPGVDVWAVYGHRLEGDVTLRAFTEELSRAFAHARDRC